MCHRYRHGDPVEDVDALLRSEGVLRMCSVPVEDSSTSTTDWLAAWLLSTYNAVADAMDCTQDVEQALTVLSLVDGGCL